MSPDAQTKEEARRLASLLAAFAAGNRSAADQLLREYEPWLRLLARVQMESCLRAKFDPSDIVQQTMIAACQGARQFRGRSEGEWLGWLRQILAHALGHEIRRYRGTQKRDLTLEQSLDQSSSRLAALVQGGAGSPTPVGERREREVLLAELLERLPADYREVIILRNLEGLSHEEIAQRINRSAGAVRMLWVRALAALKVKAAVIEDRLDERKE